MAMFSPVQNGYKGETGPVIAGKTNERGYPSTGDLYYIADEPVPVA